MWPLLAQAGDEDVGSEIFRVLIWSAVFIALLLVLFIVVSKIRKWANTDEAGGRGGGFTLSELRQLHKSGKMTAEEFEKAKAILLAAHKPGPDAPATDSPQPK